MKAILPAAGYGTRMKEITGDGSKILFNVKGKPVIEYCLEKILEIEDIDEILIVTNNKFNRAFEDWAGQYRVREGVKIRIFNDGTNDNEERLGTLRDIELVLREGNVQDDFLIVNPDNIFTWGLVEAYKRFRDTNGVLIGIIDANNIDEAKKKGDPVFYVPGDKNSKVRGFIEKNQETRTLESSIGIYFFPREIKDRLGQYLRNGGNADTSGSFIAWLVNDNVTDVYGHYFGIGEKRYFDIGSPASVEFAERHL